MFSRNHEQFLNCFATEIADVIVFRESLIGKHIVDI